ncbi:hypothetical protein [Gallaecimonas sp. GXIMD4217]|uniref:DUF6841 family protein n=1 Tax=Gallaecimonas sp. GXIMD4217 TaxID=3131927 RepID=UPI00311B1AE1
MIRRGLVWGLFFTLVLSTLSANAQTQDDADIKLLFRHYMTKYNHFLQTSELKATPALYGDTVMLMSNSVPPRTLTGELMNEQVTKFLTRLKQQGISRVEWESTNIKRLSPNLAIASNVAARYRRDGSLFNRVGATYYVYKQQGQWRISAFAIHDPGNVLSMTKG